MDPIEDLENLENKMVEERRKFVSDLMNIPRAHRADRFADLLEIQRKIDAVKSMIQDEKSRDTQGLLPGTLTLEFVVLPDGKVVEFAVENRHYRTGPMRNCMLKVFRLMRFPGVGGSNCPVSIPIKIGG